MLCDENLKLILCEYMYIYVDAYIEGPNKGVVEGEEFFMWVEWLCRQK